MEKTFVYSTSRTACPKCGSSDGFAQISNYDGAGKCHACGVFIPPTNKYKNPSYEQKQKYDKKYNFKSTYRLMIESLDIKEYIVPSLNDKADASNFVKKYLGSTSDISHLEKKYIDLLNDSFSEYDAKFQSGYYAALWQKFNGYNEFNTKIFDLYQESPALALLVSSTKSDILSDWFIEFKDGKVRYWYLDEEIKPVNYKFIKYDPDFKRDKSSPPYYLSGAKQILFGLHQLNNDWMKACDFIINHDSDVFLFESEKNAVIASAFFKDKICLATGGAKSLSLEKALPLNGKNVFIIFDADDAGTDGADHSFNNLKRAGAKPEILSLSDYIPDLPSGYDIADYFINTFKEFINGK